MATSPGDLLVLASRGLSEVRFSAKPLSPAQLVVWFGVEARALPIPSAFAKIVADGKKMGAAPGRRDVLLLAARRLE
jgi:hypothetical protein